MIVNWGVLSTATIGRKAVIPAIQSVENSKFYAIASNNERVQEFASEFDIPHVYSTYEELLDDPNIQAVYIPLPNTLHKEWVIKAAGKGKHVLCEKPAALTSKDVEEMLEACRGNNVLFMEAFMYQFHPQHHRVKELIANGEIGEVRNIRSAFTFNLDFEENQQNIRLNSELGGGSMWDVGCYCIHASRFLLDLEPTEVYVTGKVHPKFHVETRATGILTFPSGVTASFDSSFEQPMSEWYEVLGTKGSIKVPSAFRPDKRPNGLGEIVVVGEHGQERIETFGGNPYELQVDHFSECILENRQPRYSGLQTIHNIKVIEASYESLQRGLPVKL
ncbi:Gfo/Idh/MocA family protein [Bacillus sp. DJP31]|uniref:Gfo/Idh/MocA family protein n=1 Tax=Bacillus sp. DJP31 TaxID=3409789 RepID=UPI003BB546B0